MFPWFKRKKAQPEAAANELSPEADAYLAAATSEFNAKQQALNDTYRITDAVRWDFSQEDGVLRLKYSDGRVFEADGQILGSYEKQSESWEWAWNNPHTLPAMSRDSALVRQLGERFGLGYLTAGMIPIPSEEMAVYLCAIGIKATDSVGVYKGPADRVDVMIMLKRPRWAR
jgi:hypothetical protein